VDLPTIGAAYAGLKAGKELLTAVLETKIESESRARIAEALTKLGQAQDTLFELREELFRLQSENEGFRQQLAAADDWKQRLSQYSLQKTSGGAVVYAFGGQPEHFACPACISKRELHILQDGRNAAGSFTCPGCKSSFPVRPSQRLSPGRAIE
jgi:hypothetical protein